MSQELKSRITWGLGLGISVCLIIFALPSEFCFITAVGAGLLGWREYSRMMGIQKRQSFYYSGYTFILLMFTHSFFNGPSTLLWIWLAWILGFGLLYFEAIREKREGADPEAFDVQSNWTLLCRFVLGLIYIFMLFGFVGPIVNKRHGDVILFLGLLIIFGGDIGAFFVGRKYGKEKIWPGLSPAKTVQGALGGWAVSFIATMIVWVICRKTIPGTLPFLSSLVVGILAPPLAQSGDFLESLIKRVAGCKDSGTLLSSHGGILDRTDGLVFALPLIYFLF